jgi:hypothetical protein
MTHFPLTGGCNCGAVRFEVTSPLLAASYCHCKRCQRRSGAAASANAHPAPDTFRIIAGEDKLGVWKPESGGEKWFCGDCGSSLFGRNSNHADPIGIRMGTFDHDPEIRLEHSPVRGLRRAVGANPRRRIALLPRKSPRKALTPGAAEDPKSPTPPDAARRAFQPRDRAPWSALKGARAWRSGDVDFDRRTVRAGCTDLAGSAGIM